MILNLRQLALSDFLVTPPLFFGVIIPYWFLVNEWGKRRSVAKFQKEGESIKGVVADSRKWETTHESQNGGPTTEHHFELTVQVSGRGRHPPIPQLLPRCEEDISCFLHGLQIFQRQWCRDRNTPYADFRGLRPQKGDPRL